MVNYIVSVRVPESPIQYLTTVGGLHGDLSLVSDRASADVFQKEQEYVYSTLKPVKVKYWKENPNTAVDYILV